MKYPSPQSLGYVDPGNVDPSQPITLPVEPGPVDGQSFQEAIDTVLSKSTDGLSACEEQKLTRAKELAGEAQRAARNANLGTAEEKARQALQVAKDMENCSGQSGSGSGLVETAKQGTTFVKGAWSRTMGGNGSFKDYATVAASGYAGAKLVSALL